MVWIQAFYIYFGWRLTFHTSVILYRIHLGFKFKKQTFGVFRSASHISSFFVKKLCFSVFLLNSIDKSRILDLLVVNSFIGWLLFLFYLELTFKEKSFLVYRGQWETFFVCAIFVLNLLNRRILVFLDWTISFDTFFILCGIRLDFKFKKQPFRVFKGSCYISRFFVKKKKFSCFFC